MPKKIPKKPVDTETKLPVPISEQWEDYVKLLGDGKRDYIGIETGEKRLDDATLGLNGVIVLGGKAGGGKTTLAVHLARKVAENGTPVLFYSLEMPRLAILTKLLSSLSKVGYGDILLNGKTALENGESGKLTAQNLKAIREGEEKLKELSELLYIKTRSKEDGLINFNSVRADIEFIKEKHGVENVLVVVDHLQVFTPSEQVSNQIEREQNLINGFKDVSEHTGATTLLISQQNKASYNSTSATSIKGSVDIIYLADIVMFIQTEEKDEETEEIFAEFEDDIKLVIAKNRYNAPTTLKAKIDAKYSLIEFTE